MLAMFWALKRGSLAAASRAMSPNSSTSSTSSLENAHTVLDSACISIFSHRLLHLAASEMHAGVRIWMRMIDKHELLLRTVQSSSTCHVSCSTRSFPTGDVPKGEAHGFTPK